MAALDPGNPNYRSYLEFRLQPSLFLFVLIVSVCGCGKKPLSRARVQSITHDFVSAAQRAGGPGTHIAVHREKARAANKRDATEENIIIQLPENANLPAVQDALAQVAALYKLTRVPEPSPQALSAADYFFAGRRTHFIRIVRGRSPTRPWPRFAAQPERGAQLAIIIDDMGGDLNAARKLLALPERLTFSVLPDQLHSEDVANEAYRRGDEVMLHLPMEFQGHQAPSEPVELRMGMNAAQVRQRVARMAGEVPHADGVNNHEGSLATADAKLMSLLMPELRARHFFFIDSRTTASTVAYKAAKRAGLKAASRDVFLDDVETRAAILRQLALAIKDARRNGSAVAIGHPHMETIATLAQSLPRLGSKGVRLVFASDVVR